MALLPLRLRTLRQAGALTPAVARAIGAQGDLRELQVTSKEPAAPTATLLFGKLTLQRLTWRAPITAELLAALAAQPQLHELELNARDILDVEALARAPMLERLTLVQERLGNGIAAAVLQPLARSPALREVAVVVTVARGGTHPDQAELQRAVGDHIQLRLQQTETVDRR